MKNEKHGSSSAKPIKPKRKWNNNNNFQTQQSDNFEIYVSDEDKIKKKLNLSPATKNIEDEDLKTVDYENQDYYNNRKQHNVNYNTANTNHGSAKKPSKPPLGNTPAKQNRVKTQKNNNFTTDSKSRSVNKKFKNNEFSELVPLNDNNYQSMTSNNLRQNEICYVDELMNEVQGVEDNFENLNNQEMLINNELKKMDNSLAKAEQEINHIENQRYHNNNNHKFDNIINQQQNENSVYYIDDDDDDDEEQIMKNEQPAITKMPPQKKKTTYKMPFSKKIPKTN